MGSSGFAGRELSLRTLFVVSRRRWATPRGGIVPSGGLMYRNESISPCTTDTPGADEADIPRFKSVVKQLFVRDAVTRVLNMIEAASLFLLRIG
jgi:hypothetical protein